MAEKKKILFTKEENELLLGLVKKCKNVVESKESDPRIQEEYNSIAGNTKRTHVQLKKLLMNMKSIQKKELAGEKKARMGTGGSPCTQATLETPEVDLLTESVDIELPNTLDSDTLALANGAGDQFYVMSADGILVPDETSSGEQIILDATEQQQDVVSLNSAKKKPKIKEVNKEILARLHRVEVLKKNDQELHELVMEEQRLKIYVIKNQLIFQKIMQMLEEEFLKEKRSLELQLIKNNMLSTPK